MRFQIVEERRRTGLDRADDDEVRQSTGAGLRFGRGAQIHTVILPSSQKTLTLPPNLGCDDDA